MGKSNRRLAWMVSILTALAFFSVSIAVAGGIQAPGFDGRVTLDVNPSVEMIFENGIVSEVIAYNDEGQLILQNASLVGITATNSLQAILQEMADGGYLSDDGGKPYLFITTMGNGLNEDFIKDLRDTANEYIKGLGKDADVGITSLHEDISSQAAAFGLSAGRYVMMQYIAQAQGSKLEETIAQYGNTNVNTLMDSFEGLEYAIKGESLGDEEVALLVEERSDDIDEDVNEDFEDDEEKSEEQLLLEAQQRELEKQQREEALRLEAQQREAEKKQREEALRLEAQQRETEKKQREEALLVEEQQREAEKKQREEAQRLEEQQREAEKKQREEERLLEEQQRDAEKKQREEERDNSEKGKNRG